MAARAYRDRPRAAPLSTRAAPLSICRMARQTGGLIALRYDERFKLGQVDGDDVKALRKRAIDAKRSSI